MLIVDEEQKRKNYNEYKEIRYNINNFKFKRIFKDFYKMFNIYSKLKKGKY